MSHFPLPLLASSSLDYKNIFFLEDDSQRPQATLQQGALHSHAPIHLCLPWPSGYHPTSPPLRNVEPEKGRCHTDMPTTAAQLYSAAQKETQIKCQLIVSTEEVLI